MTPQADDQSPNKRIDPPAIAGEKTASVAGSSTTSAQTILLKCAGLTPAQLLGRSAPRSSLCLLGLVRHLTEVEFGWLHSRFAGEPDAKSTARATPTWR